MTRTPAGGKVHTKECMYVRKRNDLVWFEVCGICRNLETKERLQERTEALEEGIRHAELE